LHLFDTFSGLPAPEAGQDGHFRQGQFADTSVTAVRNRLARWPDIRFYPGPFPATATSVHAETFKLVHLDVDLYQSTLAGLEFFYPRLIRGGLLLVHDYNDRSVPGVKSAVDEFLARRPESLIELWDTQALIVKQ
jgi:O-methyltransferase